MKGYVLTILFASLISINSYSFYAWSDPPYFSIYYGSVYRFQGDYRHLISFDKWQTSKYSYSGYGFGLEWNNKNDFNSGIKYYFSPSRKPGNAFPVIYLAFELSIFKINHQYGANLSPQLGFHLFTGGDLGFSLNLFYGYEMPIVNDRVYFPYRHKITLKAGIDLGEYWFDRSEKVKVMF